MDFMHPTMIAALRPFAPVRKAPSVIVNYEGVELECLYGYTPAEPARRNDWDGGHPGSSASVAIHEVRHCGHDISALCSDRCTLDALEALVLRQLEG